MGRIGRLTAAALAVLAAPMVVVAPARADTGLPVGWIETVASTRVEGALGTQLDLGALGLDDLQGNDESHFPPVAVDDSGRVVFAVNDEILRVEPDGTVHRLAGLGVPGTFDQEQPARDSTVSNVRRLSVDSSGDVLVTEMLGLQVRFVVIRADGTAAVRASLDRHQCPDTTPFAPGETKACTIWDAFLGTDGTIFFLYYRGTGGTRLGVLRPNSPLALLAGNGSTSGSAPTSSDPLSFGLPPPQGPDKMGVGVAPGPNGDVDLLYDSGAVVVGSLGLPILVHIGANGATTVRGGPTQSFQFGHRDLVRDVLGNLYGAEMRLQSYVRGGSAIYRLAPNQVDPTFITGQGNGPGTDGSPALTADLGPLVGWNVSATGHYAAVISSGLMRVFAIGGTVRAVAGGALAPQRMSLVGGLSRSPTDDPAVLPGIARTGGGDLLVPGRTLYQTGAIYQLDQSGAPTQTLYAGFSQIEIAHQAALAVAVSPSGLVFGAAVVDNQYEVVTITTGPQTQSTVNLDPLLPPGAWDIAALAVGADNVAYAAVANAIYRIRQAPDGTWFAERFAGNWTPCNSTADPCAGGDGSYADSVALFAPRGLAVGPDGSLYVSEAAVHVPGDPSNGGGRIRKITPDGRIYTFAGTGRYASSGDGGPARDAELGGPGGIAFGPDGSLFIADFYASQIRRVLPDGTIDTVAGNGTYTAETDRGPALGPVFVGPASVAVDPNGVLYVYDAGTTSIRRIVPAPPVASARDPRLSSFVPVAPTRVMDTRIGLGASGPIPPGGAVTLALGGPVPADAVGVALNLTLTESVRAGYVTAWPADQARPETSNLNVDGPGQTVADLVVVPLGPSHEAAFFSFAGGQLVGDVVGYYVRAEAAVRAGRYVALTPARALDTRTSTKPGDASVTVVPLRGVAGIPTEGVAAVALNVTLTEATAPGYVQVVPTGGATPFGASSNLNAVAPGQTIANLVFSPIGADGSVSIYVQSSTHLIVDVLGYYTDATTEASLSGLFIPVVPVRLADTRQSGQKPGPATSIDVDPLGPLGLPPGQIAAIVATVTATEATAPGFVQALPTHRAAFGSSSTVNVERAGQTIANASVITVGDGDAITVYTQTGTHIVVDTQGFFLR
jgi:hypothetical protein